MPPPPHATTRKKKGRAPAHQNKFAFHHNPKSTKTERILSFPIQHVCRKCHEKLEWRKQYRKYKPLTQPSKCNVCARRNVTAAYHTLCEECSVSSDKAQGLLEEWNRNTRDAEETATAEDGPAKDTAEDTSTSCQLSPRDTYTRVCAMCVKEPALPDETSNANDPLDQAGQGRLKLRQLKTLERQKEKARQRQPRNRNGSNEGSNDDDDSGSSRGSRLDAGSMDPDTMEDDPFLRAIGGIEQMVVGDAYQQRRLQESSLPPE